MELRAAGKRGTAEPPAAPLPAADDQPRKSVRVGARTVADPAPPTPEEVTVMGRSVLDALMELHDARDGDALTAPFLKLPSRRQYPDYYVVIKRPITLADVRNRLKQHEYASLHDVRQDLELVCNNAKRYNERDSDIWLKARDLHSAIKDRCVAAHDAWLHAVGAGASAQTGAGVSADAGAAKRPRTSDSTERAPKTHRVPLRAPRMARATPESSAEPDAAPPRPMLPTPTAPRSVPGVRASPVVPPPTPPPQLGEARRRGAPRGKRLKVMLRWAVSALMQLQDREYVDTRFVPDRSGRSHAELFMELPSRDEYPDYYQFIKHPISFGNIEAKLDAKEYINTHALVTDLAQMLDNAQFYNEEDSIVWNDAQELRVRTAPRARSLQMHLENTLIPAFLAEGFTLDPNDHRQAAVPPGMPGYVPPPTATLPRTPPAPAHAAPPSAALPSASPLSAAPPRAAPPAVPPVAPPPPPPAPAKVSLERVVRDLERAVWPPHPALFEPPAALYTESSRAATARSPFKELRLCLFAPRDADAPAAQIAVQLHASVEHAVRIPARVQRTEWRLRMDAAVSDLSVRTLLDQREVPALYYDDVEVRGDIVTVPGSHVLDAYWAKDGDDASLAGHLRVYLFHESAGAMGAGDAAAAAAAGADRAPSDGPAGA
ncbi:hypothetical protein MSPP1_001475 [Malassezia sp. CBS 17886]|nr:hypothetical protein MSPP1_001475 [Malassezia sp. CBS 17886]